MGVVVANIARTSEYGEELLLVQSTSTVRRLTVFSANSIRDSNIV